LLLFCKMPFQAKGWQTTLVLPFVTGRYWAFLPRFHGAFTVVAVSDRPKRIIPLESTDYLRNVPAADGRRPSRRRAGTRPWGIGGKAAGGVKLHFFLCVRP
jgi:hypothetical protein